jgi:hypothetical protein
MSTGRHIPTNFPQGQVQFPGDHRLRTIGRQLESAVIEIGRHGPIVSGTRTLRDAIGHLGRTGGRILVGEGIWSFNKQIVISRPNVHIISTSPGKSVFINKIDDPVSANQVMLVAEGDEFIIEGVRFINETNTQHQVKITGDHSTIRNCVFEKFGAGCTVVGGDYAKLEGNRFIDGTSGYNMALFSSSHNIISNNIFADTTGATQLYLSNTVDKTVIVGNVFDWTAGVIGSPYRGTGMQTDATLALMNVVQTGNITEVT